LAQKQGWDVAGIEINQELASFVSRELGIETYTGSLFNVDLPDDYFQIIILIDVLEHLYDPVKTLTRCYRLLKSNGVLVVKTPYWKMQHNKEVIKKLFRVGTGNIATLGHINQFDPCSIKLAFRKSGFDIIGIYPARSFLPGMKGAPFSLKRSLEYSVRATFNGLVELLFRITSVNLSFNLLSLARKRELVKQ
jgi:SAM-dependent methyltransferase